MLLTISALSVLTLATPDTVPQSWQVTGDVVGNPVNEVCTVVQEGTALTGSCTAGAETYPLTGEVKEGKVTFTHPGGEYEGQPLTLTFMGTIVSETEIRGTIEVQPFAVTGDFVAKPVPVEP